MKRAESLIEFILKEALRMPVKMILSSTRCDEKWSHMMRCWSELFKIVYCPLFEGITSKWSHIFETMFLLSPAQNVSYFYSFYYDSPETMDLFLVQPLANVYLIEVCFISWYELANFCERVCNRKDFFILERRKKKLTATNEQ